MLPVQEQGLVSVSRQVVRAAAQGLGSLAVLALAGCGNNYRPVVSAINPVGPSSQPTVYATALADPGNGNNALVTVVDVFGDTVTATAAVNPAPTYLLTDTSGQSYVLHSGTPLIDTFTSAAGLMTSLVRQSSLDASTCVTGKTTCLGQATANTTSGPLFITEPAVNKVAVFTAGTPPTIRQELPVAPNPIYTIANGSASRAYVLSQGVTPGTSQGTATAVEAGTAANNAISATIPVGINPVYGIMNSDARRAFVLNNGSGTVTAINTQGNSVDKTITVGTNPVWADVSTSTNEIAVLNQGVSGANGSVSVINIALCNPTAITGNVTCDPNNPVDAASFGSVLGTIPVGRGAIQVAVLAGANKAYVANAADGTVTVVDMTTMVATKTINVGGRLNWIQAVAGAPTGKILVTAADTQVLTIIRTDTDAVSTTVNLQGFGVSVRVAQ